MTSNGGAHCWGSNAFGQLGNGSSADAFTAPTEVLGLSSGVSAISAGWFHTCALTTAGGVKCWGNNVYGQLGNGSTAESRTAVDVTGLTSGVAAVTTGYSQTCALMTTGGVKCWGSNSDGQLGNGSTNSSSTPVDVSGLSSGVSAISTAGVHTCALTTAGGVKCWGNNVYGQLGDGSTTVRRFPVDVWGLSSGVSVISAGGFHNCAVTTAGAAKCWGRNSQGELGNGSTVNSSTPDDVSGLSSGVSSISAGKTNDTHTCALLTTGTAKCWGANSQGQLGNGSTTGASRPVDVSGLSDVSSITAGTDHTCGLTTAGAVKCWGSNTHGQLGNASTSQSSTPVDVVYTPLVVGAISAGDGHTCALTTAGAVKCWGDNARGQLGDGSTTSRSTLVGVRGLGSGVVAISAGSEHTCAVTSAGAVKCWGSNIAGQLGDGSTVNSSTPVAVSGLSSGVSAVSAGGHYTCALTTAGAVKCWGHNSAGQLGDGSNTNSSTPVDVAGLSSGVAAISTGTFHTCALTTAGAVKCWGFNDQGRLGNGSNTNSSTPVAVSGLSSGVSAVSAGGFHTCALTTSGAGKCWGGNGAGQLGNGSTTNSWTPVDVSGASGLSAISSGNAHTCAVTTAAAVKCWGWNLFGQLGDGSTTNSSTPAEVGAARGASAIGTGAIHTCTVTTDGGVQCWGNNSYGQLGNRSNTNSSMPVDVLGLVPPDTTPPDTAITLGPSGPTNVASPSFAFASNEAGSTFQCKLDGPGATTGSYGSCALRANYSSLADGSYTFSVRATDATGNTDPTPATRSFTVDTVAPDTTITSGPSGPTNVASPSFTFESTEPGSIFHCALDSPRTIGDAFRCTSPVSFSLSNGTYTLWVEAVDPASNTDFTPAGRSFRVDTVVPDTTITSGPLGATNVANPSFALASSEAESTFECKLDGPGAAAGTYGSCTSPASYSSLTDGNYTFSVRATDAAGNTDPTPATRSFTVDTAAPDTTITSGPLGATGNASPSFAFTSSETGSTFQCKLDGPGTTAGSYVSCVTSASYSDLAYGTYTFSVRATDAAGNTDPTPATRSFTVTPPDLETTIAGSPEPVLSGEKLTYTIRVANTGLQTATAVWVDDVLPESVHFELVSSTQGTCTFVHDAAPKKKDGTVACGFGNLEPGASATVTLVVKVTRPGTLTNTANAIASNVIAEADDSATTTATVLGT